MLERIRDFFKTFMLLELVKGLALTGRHFFARKITVQYPEEKTPQGFRFRGLHAQRREFRIQIVESGGEQVGVDRRQLKTAVAQIDRRIEGRRVFLPLAAQPVFDLRTGGQETALQFEQGAGEGCREVGNHMLSLSRNFCCGRKSYTAVHKWGLPFRNQAVENR